MFSPRGRIVTKFLTGCSERRCPRWGLEGCRTQLGGLLPARCGGCGSCPKTARQPAAARGRQAAGGQGLTPKDGRGSAPPPGGKGLGTAGTGMPVHKGLRKGNPRPAAMSQKAQT